MFEETDALLEQITPLIIVNGLNIIGALIILFFGWTIAKWTSNRAYSLSEKTGKIDETISRFIRQFVRLAIMVVTVLAVLNRFGVETTSIIAVLGAATLAVGLALQGTLSNVAAGVMLLIFRPFKVDDAVTVAGISGSVIEIGIFTTLMKTFDGVHMIVPNGKIWGTEVTNFSKNPSRRHNLVFGIGYGDDMTKAIKIITEILENDPRVLKDPAPLVAVSELGDSSVDILARPWTNTADFWAFNWDIRKKVKEEFDANGISIPFPQRDVHLYQTGGKS